MLLNLLWIKIKSFVTSQHKPCLGHFGWIPSQRAGWWTEKQFNHVGDWMESLSSPRGICLYHSCIFPAIFFVPHLETPSCAVHSGAQREQQKYFWIKHWRRGQNVVDSRVILLCEGDCSVGRTWRNLSTNGLPGHAEPRDVYPQHSWIFWMCKSQSTGLRVSPGAL